MNTQKAFLVTVLCCLVLWSCDTSEKKGNVSYEQNKMAAMTGQQLSQEYCQSCHLYPEPEILDKKTWRQHVLPEMGRYLGIYEDSVSRSDVLAGAINKESAIEKNVFPEKQLISSQKWRKIKDFYLASAPESLPPNESSKIESGPLERFETIVPSFGTEITMIKIDSERSHIYVGETQGGAGSLTMLNSDFEILNNLEPPTPPVDVTISGGGIALTLIGTLVLSPSNNPFGELARLSPAPGGGAMLLKFPHPLMRPLQTIFEDINGDGFEDILIAEFGYYTGALTLYENRGTDGRSYKKRTLKDVPGAVRMQVRDMNNDGYKDIVALFAQADEGVSIFYNDGQDSFKEERILRFSPAYGSVHFELADFNNDNAPDILYCNGDNGDYPPILKNYHGIRIFENDGENNFEQVYFFPMYGAYKCSAADFNKDENLDITAISYFPDLASERRKDFVYLKNIGNYSFSPHYLQNNISIRWTTFDIADLDENGYKDILLGGFSSYKAYEDTTTEYSGAKQGRGSLLFLKNIGN